MLNGQIALYLDDYTDEVMPCDATPEGWAVWLSKPDADWGRDEAAKPGDTFRGTTMRFVDDIVASRLPDGTWSFSREVDDAQLLAIRFAPGIGWDADNICADMDELRAKLIDHDMVCSDEEHIAVGYDQGVVLVTFNDCAPLTIEPLQ